MMPEWLKVAYGEIGEKEVAGPEANPHIVEYFKAVTYHATSDEVPWCSAFVNWCMKQAGTEGSNSAAAVSWLHWGHKLNKPQIGCITIFEWASGGHHVTFYLEDDGHNYIKCLGGNQGNMVKVSSFPKARIMGYRWPKEA